MTKRSDRKRSDRKRSDRKRSDRKRSDRKQKRTYRKQTNQRKTMRGGTFNVPIRSFYPQNTFEHDPSRQNGGNHSRKYLKKGGSGFFSNFGTLTGQQNMANQITGSYPSLQIQNSYKV